MIPAMSSPRPCATSVSKRPGSSSAALSAQVKQVVEAHHHRVLEMPEPFHVPDDHLSERRCVLPEGKRLVELLLVFADVDHRAGMADDILALLHGVRRVDPDEGGPGGHRPQGRIEPLGLILADDGHVVPLADAECVQAEGHLPDLLQVFRPGDVVPDAEVLPPHRHPSGSRDLIRLRQYRSMDP